jgi:hypothetical protein
MFKKLKNTIDKMIDKLYSEIFDLFYKYPNINQSMKKTSDDE